MLFVKGEAKKKLYNLVKQENKNIDFVNQI